MIVIVRMVGMSHTDGEGQAATPINNEHTGLLSHSIININKQGTAQLSTQCAGAHAVHARAVDHAEASTPTRRSSTHQGEVMVKLLWSIVLCWCVVAWYARFSLSSLFACILHPSNAPSNSSLQSCLLLLLHARPSHMYLKGKSSYSTHEASDSEGP